MDTSYEEVLEQLNALNILKDECPNNNLYKTINIFVKLYEEQDEIPNKIAVKCLSILKRACMSGQHAQDSIMSCENFLETIKLVIINPQIAENIKINSLQLLANLTVQNYNNQVLILADFGHLFLKNVGSLNKYANVSAMCLYNGFISKKETSCGQNDLDILNALIANIEKCNLTEIPEFVCIFMEFLLSQNCGLVEIYPFLETNRKMVFLEYTIEYVRQEECQKALNIDFFKYLLMEFKKKSDCVLKTVTEYVEQINPAEIFTLLKLITECCCREPYSIYMKKDGSLFLNIGCLLRNIQSVGNASDNIFTPIQKIEEILSVKKQENDIDIEKDVSYSLKSMLIKCLANLTFQNKKNQDLAREMGIMAAVLECTNLDARNPLIKEWSILAIRNLCENNLENQKFISSLSKLGNANNSLVTEYTGGTVRIKENKN